MNFVIFAHEFAVVIFLLIFIYIFIRSKFLCVSIKFFKLIVLWQLSILLFLIKNAFTSQKNRKKFAPTIYILLLTYVLIFWKKFVLLFDFSACSFVASILLIAVYLGTRSYRKIVYFYFN